MRTASLPRALRRPRTSLLVLSSLVTLFGLTAALPAAAQLVDTLHVSTSGNDGWTGLLPQPNPQHTDGPLASLCGARDKLRVYRSLGILATDQPIRVKIQSGEYTLASACVFAPRDSGTAVAPIVFENAHPVRRPLFTGGERLTGFTSDGTTWTLTRPEFQRSHPSTWNFEQLWVNGRRAQPARSPNREAFSGAAPTSGWHQRLTYGPPYEPPPPPPQAPPPPVRNYYVVAPAVMALLTPLSPTQLQDVQVTHMDYWIMGRNFIDHLDVPNSRVYVQGNAPWQAYPPPARSRLEFLGLPSSLDAPGEFQLDRDLGVLRYRPFPGESLADSVIVAPRCNTPELVSLNGAASAPPGWVEHIQFRGLRFQHAPYLLRRTWVDNDKFTGGYNDSYSGFSLPAAITLNRSRDVALEDLEIAHTGATAIWLRGGSERVRVADNRLFDLGGGGVKVLEYDPAVAYALGRTNAGSTVATGGSHVIENNVIQSGGRSFFDTTATLISMSPGNTIAHNDVGDFFYSGVAFFTGRLCGQPTADDGASHDHVVRYNRIHQIGQEMLSDLGGLYFFGPHENTTVSYNQISFVRHWGEGLEDRLNGQGGGYLGAGVYLDQSSHHVSITSNLIFDVESSGLWLAAGQGREIRNNIFAFTAEGALSPYSAGCLNRPPEINATVEQNLFYFAKSQAGLMLALPDSSNLAIDNNLYYKTTGGPLGFNFYTWPLSFLPFANWQASGFDQSSVLLDPLFDAPATWDFDLQPTSPALQAPVNFVPIVPPEAIGVLPSSPAAARAARLETPPADFGGMYGVVENVARGNPLYGGIHGCPPGYTDTRVLGTAGLDYAMGFCHRPLDDQRPLADFGGMYGWVEGALVPNPLTGSPGCPAGFVSEQVLGTTNVDYPLYYCYRAHGAAAAPYEFGGLYGMYYDAETSHSFYPNPLTGRRASCPSGFPASTVFGTTGVDYPIVVCARPTP